MHKWKKGENWHIIGIIVEIYPVIEKFPNRFSWFFKHLVFWLWDKLKATINGKYRIYCFCYSQEFKKYAFASSHTVRHVFESFAKPSVSIKWNKKQLKVIASDIFYWITLLILSCDRVTFFKLGPVTFHVQLKTFYQQVNNAPIRTRLA